MQVDVVLRGLEPLDVAGGDQELGADLADQKALGPLDGIDRRAGVRGGEQARFALQSQQQQPVEIDADEDRGVRAHVLQVLVRQLAGPVAEVVVVAVCLIDKVSQADHAEDVQERVRNGGEQMPQDRSPPRVQVERDAALERELDGH